MAARAEEINGSVHILYYARRGDAECSKKGGASVQICAPPLHPRDGGFAGIVILLRRTNLILHNVPELSQKPMEEIVNIINDHFATICKMYPPLDNAIVINENEN